MEEITILSDSAAKRFKAMYGEKGKKKATEHHRMEDMVDEFKKLGQLEEVG